VEDEEVPDPISALIPGGGWMIYHGQQERTPGALGRVVFGRETVEPAEWSEPVVAWALLASGAVVPLGANPNGTVWSMSAEDDELWHPDSTAPPAQDHLRRYRDQIEAGGG
jgi:hypothetical protein